MKSELELLEEKVQRLKMLQSNCNHNWNDTIYEPEKLEIINLIIKMRTGEFKIVDRWSRTCSKCGKKEYTYEQEDIVVKTIKKPKF